MTNFIPFANPIFSDEKIEQVTRTIKGILKSGQLTTGPMAAQFEKRFADYVGSKHAVALNSCTASLHSILLALDIGPGDEVIVPSNTFVATANVVLYTGAKPIFADSDKETFNISKEGIIEKLSEKTKAIIVVHLGGNPCDLEEIVEIADNRKIRVIEDSAHALGAKLNGSSCGTMGVAGAFSFYPTKIITSAEGGMVTTDQEWLANRIKIIRNHGRATFGPSEIVEIGYNYRLSDIHASLGLVQLDQVEQFVSHRNTIALEYEKQLASIQYIKAQRVREGNFSSYYAYIVRLEENAPISRDELRKKLSEYGIGTSVLYNPIHHQPAYTKRNESNNIHLPVAEDLGERSLALPMHYNLSKDNVVYISESLKKTLVVS